MATTGEALLHDGRQSAAAIKHLVQAQDLFSDGLTLHRARIKRKYRELLCEHLPLAHEHATERHLWKYGFHVIIEQYRSITRKVSSEKKAFFLCFSIPFFFSLPSYFLLYLCTACSMEPTHRLHCSNNSRSFCLKHKGELQ